MTRQTTVEVTDVLEQRHMYGGRRYLDCTVKFVCCNCGHNIVWDGFQFDNMWDVRLAEQQPEVWLCDSCQADADEIYANRNAGI